MAVIIFYIVLGMCIVLLPKYIRYSGSSYKVASGNSFFTTVLDKGNYGEFLTYSMLESLKAPHKLMSNLYIPREDGTTTELDLIMIAETGIYVFESKNYSGWIFGDERYKHWTQTLPNKQKYKFFNPIWQNKAHIKALEAVIGIEDKELTKSYIIFSERCTLKKINVISPFVRVIKRDSLMRTLKQEMIESRKVLSLNQIDRIYFSLKPYTLADAATKQAHIEAIKTKATV